MSAWKLGIALQGWEVKSLRDGRIQFGESYALLRNGEAYLFGAQISPRSSASTHVIADKMRNRKLLLHRLELDRLIGAVERKGYTVIPSRCTGKATRSRSNSDWPKASASTTSAMPRRTGTGERDKGRIMRERNR